MNSIKMLDTMYSKFIRMRAIARCGGCERCLSAKRDIIKENGNIFPSWKQLQCSHFFGRAKHSVRWDEDNAAGLCGACHLYFTAHPYEHGNWIQERLGDRFPFLVARAYITHPKPDKESIRLYLQEMIKGNIKS